MSDVKNQTPEEVRTRQQHSTQPAHQAEPDRGLQAPGSGAAYLDLLLRHDPIAGWGNSEARAGAMQAMQQTHGNNAVQRFVQRATAQRAVPVQRGLSDLLADPFEQINTSLGLPKRNDMPSTTAPGPAVPAAEPVSDPNVIKMPLPFGKGMTISKDLLLNPGDSNKGYGEANRDIPGINTPSNDIEEEDYDPMFRTAEQELEDEKMGIDSFWDSAEVRKEKKAEYRAWEAKEAEEDRIRAEAQRKKAEEREALRKTDPELALKLDRKEAVARAMSNLSRNMGDVPLSSGESSVGSEIVGKVSDAVDNPLGTAVKVAEYAKDPAKLGVDAGKAVFGAGETTVGPDGKPRKGPSLFDRGLNEAEEGINNATKATADTISDIPIVGDMAKPYVDTAANYVESQTEITVGGLKAVGTMAGGVSTLAADPEGTAKMAWKMGENTPLPPMMNPFRLAHAGYDYVTNNENLDLSDVYRRHLDPVTALKEKAAQDTGMLDGMLDPYKQSWEQGRYGEMAGRAMVDIGSLFIGGGGSKGAAGAASKLDDMARAAGSMDDVGRVNPYGKTMPGPGAGPGNPHAPTMVDAPGVNPYGKTSPVGPAKPSQKVMEMDAIPPDYYPGMTQPPGWKAGPYGSRGPAPVDPLGQTMHGPGYDPFPNPVQVPAGKGPVNPYGSTVDIGTGPNPTGQTWLDVGKGGVDPYGRTVNVPVAHDAVTLPGYGGRPGSPMGPTRLDVPEFSPYGQTQPMPANPYGATQPGTTPINPTAPTMQMPATPYLPSQTPTLTGIGPVMHPSYNIPGMGGVGDSVLSTWDAIKSLF